MKTIPFNEFMAVGSFNINNGVYSISDAYLVVGGMGLAAIGLFWLESKGKINVDERWVKGMFVLMYAVLLATFLLKGKFWSLLM